MPEEPQEFPEQPARMTAWRCVVLALLVSFPSLGFTQKFIGLWCVPLHVVATAALIQLSWLVFRRLGPFFRKRFGSCSVVALLALFVGYLVLHPFEDGRGPGRSSDRDEGLEIAVARLSHGESPYYPQNEVAGPLSLLPGSIILAAPFVWIGNVGLQNIFWLAVLLIMAVKLSRDGAVALWLLCVPFALSPAAVYEWISGGDMIANGIFVAAALFFALSLWNRPDIPAWGKLAGCLALGIALASRANFVFLLPVFGAAVWRVAGWRAAFVASALAGVATLGITLPFYLADPDGFTPLMSRGKISFLDPSLWWAPHAIVVLTVVVALSSAVWILQSRGEPFRQCLAGCALTTLAPNLAMVIMMSLLSGQLDFGFTRDRFGLMYVFLALLAWVPAMGPAEREPESVATK